MKKYLLGVDGGNTKTDYLLFDFDGNFIDGIRLGTCSHEALKDSFDGTYREMKAAIIKLLNQNNLKITDIFASVFGLAGCDVPSQKIKLEEIVRKIGFANFVVNNDGFLGIKAASHTGSGVCSINGTGTVTVGIDEDGSYVQVGGVGYISGDEAGGAFLARRVLQAVYDEGFRMGKKTSLTPKVYKILGITNKEDYLSTLINFIEQKKLDRTALIKLLFNQGNLNDEVSLKILSKAGENMGLSVAGCINNLNFKDFIIIVLAGSVWANATCDAMFNAFKDVVEKNSFKKCEYSVLIAPPAAGAILWAYELAHRTLPKIEIRNKVLKQVESYQHRLKSLD